MTYREYSDYTRLLKGWLNKEIDVAALPENYKGMFETNEEIAPELAALRDVHNFNRTLTIHTEQGSDKDVTKEPFTVLIIGVDDDRSDALMLATVNPSSMTVLLTSIPRDSYVPIAAIPIKSRIRSTIPVCAAANARWIRSNSCWTSMWTSTLKATSTASLKLVDALGGVIIDNPKEFVGQILR